jgi:3-oxoacyl-[acyl-carrier protein] reductase
MKTKSAKMAGAPQVNISSGKTAIVTGGRRGIGRAIAYALASRGFNIVVNDIVDDNAARETTEGLQQLGVRSLFVQGDISRLDDHELILDRALETFGSLDCLVNNAGIQVRNRGDVLEVTPERFDEMMGINLRGVFFLTQAFARKVLAQGVSPEVRRSIITITSSNAVMVSTEKSEYCISKSALSMASKLFAVRLASCGIRVFEVRPGLIRTEMTASVRDKYGVEIERGLSPIARWGEPEEVAEAVASLATGSIPFSTGSVINIDGGLQIQRL